MVDRINITNTKNKQSIYRELVAQIELLLQKEPDLIANMANVAAALKEAFNFFWIGFYIVRQKELVLGPFQGPLACTRISYRNGVCGKSWEKKETIIVADVNQFPGHISCSAESKSEIVVPGILDGQVRFVLDIDSNRLNEFDKIDADNLRNIVLLIIRHSQV